MQGIKKVCYLCETYTFKRYSKEYFGKISKKKWSFLKGVRQGVLTVSGSGDVNFQPIFDILEKANDKGYVVVEAEQDPVVANSLEYAIKARKYIAEKTEL